jgi:predicted porin
MMEDADYTRFSVDSQIDIANFRFMGVYTQAEDDVIGGNGSVTQEDNDAFYLQGQYMFMQDGRPTFVPMVRFDQYEKKDGAEEYKEYTVNLGYYFTENIRGYIEYWDRYDVPKGKDEDDRLTVQVEAVF